MPGKMKTKYAAKGTMGMSTKYGAKAGGLVKKKATRECSIKLVDKINTEQAIDLVFVDQISIDITSKFCINVDMEITSFNSVTLQFFLLPC